MSPTHHRTFASFFAREKPRNVNELLDARATRGERAADWVAATVGSWPFIIVQSCLLAVWVALNVTAWVRHWDPYPFILMNLVLSLQAAYAAPIIMMSQNRQAARDRVEAHNDFLTDVAAEEEVRAIMAHLEAQDRLLGEILARLDAGGGGASPRSAPRGDDGGEGDGGPRPFPYGASLP